MPKKMRNYTILKTFLVLFIAYLPFLGSDCNTNTIGGQTGGNINGTWQLNFIQGNLQDVCMGEVVTFPSNTSGNATLTCPNQSPITRPYSYADPVITYTDTGVKYTVTTSSSSVLVLTGTFTRTVNGVQVTDSRILSYTKIATDKPVETQGTVTNSNSTLNSSEQNKTK